MNSIWSETANDKGFEALEGDIKVDVLVIGGGMAGILCAHALSKAGVDHALVEADRICGGITKNTTAKITSQHGLIYHKLIEQFDLDTARTYLRANEEAIIRFRKLCKDIDCDYRELPSFVYSENDGRKIEKEMAALDKIGYDAKYESEIDLPFSVEGAVRFDRQAEFHPLKFAYALAKGLRIYERTKVLELLPDGAVTNKGRIFAEKIIVATHFPFINKHGAYFLKQYQHRSYVLALKGAPDLKGMYVDERDDGMSFRNFGEYLLLGGGGHRTGKKGSAWAELEVFADRHYPEAKKEYKWATQDCMTLDRVAYIGQYSKGTPNMYVATGFNKWGMTSSMVSAMILSDMVMGRENQYAPVFSPSRTIFRRQLAVNAAEAIINLLTPTTPRCPHLGCALKYNPQEHSWDCPCHGSRFTSDMQLIDNPAADDIKK